MNEKKKKLNLYDWYSSKKAEGEKEVNKDYIDKFLKESQTYFDKSTKSSENMGYGNAKSISRDTTMAYDSLKDKGYHIQDWLEKNKYSLDETTYKELYDSVNQIIKGGKDVRDSFSERQKSLLSTFKNELEYEMAYEQYNIDNLKEEDLVKDIEDYEKQIKDINRHGEGSTWWDKMFVNYGKLDEVSELERKIAFKKQLIKEIQNKAILEQFESLRSGEDFEELSKYDEGFYEGLKAELQNRKKQKTQVIDSIVNPQGTPQFYVPSSKYSQYTDAELEELIAKYKEANYVKKDMGIYDIPVVYDYLTKGNMLYMSDEQTAMYNYLLKTRGKAESDKYLSAIRDDLIAKKGESMATDVITNYPTELFGVYAGLDQFVSGIEGLFGNDTTVSEVEIASAKIQEHLDKNGLLSGLPDWMGGGSLVYDFTTTSANMLPSILASGIASYINPSLGAYVGAGLLGASAGGNARIEMLRLGYNEEQANMYALLIGASEAGLQYFLGGVASLGGKFSSGLKEIALKKVDNAIGRAAITLGANAMSEGIEEGLQTVLEAWFKSVVTGADFEAPDIDEVLYSTLLGMLMGAFFEAPTVASQTSQTKALGSQFSGDQAATIQEAIDVGAISQAKGQKLLEKLAKGKTISDYKIGSLATKTEETLVEQDKGKIQSAVQKRLESLGEDSTSAKKLSEIIAKQTVGEETSLYEKTYLMTSKNAKKVSSELKTDGSRVIPSWVKTIGTEKVNSEYYSPSPDEFTYNEKNDKVTIESVESTDGKITVKTSDGSTRAITSLELGTNDKYLMGAVKALKLSPEQATEFVKGFEGSTLSAEEYALSYSNAYRIGELGLPYKELATSDLATNLPESIKQKAYDIGRGVKTESVKADQEKVKAITTGKSFTKKGAINYETKIDTKKLTPMQKASIKVVEKIAEITGTNIYMYESLVDENGKRLGANGKFFPSDNSIHLDLYAGAEGRGTILYTLSHELVHYIKVWSPEQYQKLTEVITEYIVEKGQSINELVTDQIAKAKENRRDIDYEVALEEVIADSCESLLTDETVLKELPSKIKEKSETLWNKIKTFFAKIIAKIKEVYSDMLPDSKEGRMVAEIIETTKDIQRAFVNALVSASENYTAVDGNIEISTETESAAPMLSLRTWTESDYVQKKKQIVEAISQRLNVSKAKAEKYVNDINSIANLIATDRVRLDYEASSFGSAFVSNVEYGGSFDFSTICKKRRLYTGTFSKIQEILKDEALSPDDILEIRNMLIEEKVEATCGLCYVEGSRANMGKFAKEFIRLYKRDNPNAWIPNMADVNTPDGVEKMRINHPECYEQYEYFWNHYGKLKDSDPALFASQQKPKLYESRKEYKGEILESFKNDTTVEKKNLNGGIRMQSFSGFEIVHLIDTMQIIMDMSMVGLSGQAYTKVPEFAMAFGNTGLKINLSLIAKGVDENGQLIFDDREGMPHETAFNLRKRFSKNVGTIIVIFTDEQLYAAMADSRIDYIIPFHRSQWKKGQYNAMGLPKGTKDYTYMQNEKLIKQTYHEYQGRQVKDKASNYMPNEYWDFSKTGKENAEHYLEMCYKNNKRPKFYKLLDYDGNGRYSLKKDGSTDGYWKLLIDFKMYDNDGVGSPQMAVTPTFEMDDAIKMLNENKGGHQNYPVQNSVVDKFVKKYKEEHKIKYSYRGQNAKADNSQLSVAMDMETKGVSSEQIRQETGWFKGIDGKWRIEIDDSKMTLKSFNPSKTNLMLNDVIEHKELFDAYPQLNDVWFGIDPTMSEDGRTTGSGIVLRKAPTTTMDKRILLHEIQHLIQYIEGFATGSNQNMFQYDEWDSTLQEALDRRNEYANKLYAILRRNGQSISKEEISENQYFNTRGRDSIIDEHYFLLSNLAEKNAKTNQIWEEYWKATRELVLSTPYGKYMNTAGEIEAYDVQARATMSTEERKAMRPNVDVEGSYIRYSDRDSLGRELTKSQQEYFKDSKIRDENGSLIEVYHGSQSKFTEFKHSKMGLHGNAHGRGFYFTDDVSLASSFSTKEGQLLNGYLNITNPMSETQKTIKKADLEKFIKLICEKEAKALVDTDGYDKISDALKDTFVSNYVYTYNMSMSDVYKEVANIIFNGNDNDVDIIAELTNAYGGSTLLEDVYDVFGYDGVIYTNDDGTHEYVTFRSNQFKSTTNKNPTSDNDIRYSDRTNVGYHAGDLGKSKGDFLSGQGYGRDTGHFGSGTYFVGNEEQINIGNYVNRPHHAVDFSNYNLYKIKSNQDGWELHDQLRVIDGGFSKEWLDAALNSEYGVSTLRSQSYKLYDKYYEESDYDENGLAMTSNFYEAMYKAYTEVAEKNNVDVLSYEEWCKENGEQPSNNIRDRYAYVTYLKEQFETIDDELNDKYSRFRKIVFPLQMRFGFKQVENALREVLKYEQETESSRFNYNKQLDSYATVFMKALGYEGVDTRGTSLDNTGYGSVIYDLKEDTILYSDRDKISNRTLLANALETVAANDIERNNLEEYKKQISKLDADTKRLAEVRAEIKELSFGKGTRDTKRLSELKNEAVKLENRISIYDKKLLRLESTTALKDLLNRERDKAYKMAKEKYGIETKKAISNITESRAKKDAKDKLFRTVLNTIKWLKSPTKEEVKCPDYLREPLAGFLQSIDYSSKRLASGGMPTLMDARMTQRLRILADTIKQVREGTSLDKEESKDKNKKEESLTFLYGGYLDLPDDFVDSLTNLAKNIELVTLNSDITINEMTSAQLKDLNTYIEQLVHAIKNMAVLYNNLAFKNANELGMATVEELNELGKITKTNKVIDFVAWNNALPYYAFQRFGKGGESIFTELQDAQDKLAFLSKEIFDFKNKTWTDKESTEWSKDVHTIELDGGKTITLTTAQAMGIYCLSQRVTEDGNMQGMEHMTIGGVKIVGLKKLVSQETDTDYNLSYQDVLTINSSLTERQKEVANAMQNFMSTVCAEWGNEISMRRFLVRQFTETKYYPIESDPTNLETSDDQGRKQSDLFRLLNISATKALTPKANNRIIIRNIFEVFAGHTSDMARLNSFGMAILDYMKWLNYRTSEMNDEGKLITNGVRQAMIDAYGSASFSYVLNMVKDINGRFNDNPDNPFIMGMIRLGKTAAVGANLRVALLQFTSYPRAGMVLSTKNLILGLTKAPKISMAKKYCGIALWKSFGFYDTNIAKSVEEQLKGVKNIRSKLIELSMKGAEWADAITWGALWNACEYEVAETTKNEIGSEEFYKEVALKLREVVYKTQVVDSVLTRSQIMRNKSGLTQTVTAFMSESTLTNNILMDAISQYVFIKRKGGSNELALRNARRLVFKAFGNFAIVSLTVTALESLFDAIRDDDDDEFTDKYLSATIENLVSNMNLLNNIPVIANISQTITYLLGVGYGASSSGLETQWLTNIQNAYKSWYDVINEYRGVQNTSKTAYKAIYDTIKAVSSATGLPFGNLLRELVTMWNNTVGLADSTLKIRTYEQKK